MGLKVVFGIKIYLKEVIANDYDIGIYSMPAPYNSQIRLVSNFITDIPWFNGEFYTSSLILEKTNISISEKLDLRKQGGTVISDDYTFYIDNTSRYYKSLDDLGIYLNGLSAEVIMFDIENNTSTVLTKGIAYLDSYNETEYIVSVKTTKEKRNANMATVIDNTNYPNATDKVGEIIPLMYGTIKKAKFIRIEDKVTNFKVTSAFNNYITPIGQTVFPCIGGPVNWDTSNTPVIYIRLGQADKTYLSSSAFNAIYNMIGKYVHVVKGHQEGYFRKIKYASYHPTASIIYGSSFKNANLYPILKLELETHFTNDNLHGNWDAIDGYTEYGVNDDDREISWVEIVDVNFIYQGSLSDNHEWIDSEGNVLDHQVEGYIYDSNTTIENDPTINQDYVKITNEAYDQIPAYGLVEYSWGKKMVKVDANFLTTSTESMDSFAYSDVKSVNLINNSTILGNYVSDKDPVYLKKIMTTTTKVQDGFFSGMFGTNGVALYKYPLNADLADLNNRKYNDSDIRWVWGNPTFDWDGWPNNFIYQTEFNVMGIEIELPEIADDFDFDEAYIQVAAVGGKYINDDAINGSPDYPSVKKCKCSSLGGNMYMMARLRQFYSGVEDIFFNFNDTEYPIGHGDDPTSEVITPASVNISTNIITTALSYNTGELIKLSSTTSVPIPLVDGDNYFVIRVDATHIKLAYNYLNAINGNAIDLEFAGVGNITLNVSSAFITREQRFWHTSTSYDAETPVIGGDYNNFLHSYWLDGEDPGYAEEAGYTNGNGEKRFYRTIENSTDLSADVIRGNYQLIKIPLTKENWKKCYKIGLFFLNEDTNGSDGNTTTVGDYQYLQLKQLKILFKKKVAIKNEIFVPIESKQDSEGLLIEDPVTMIYDIVHYQNWSDINDITPTGGWGKAPATNVLVKTDSSHGSFWHEDMYDVINYVKASVNITKEDAAWTQSLIEKLCKQFWLCSFQDNNGLESIDYMINTHFGSEPTITKADIVGKIKNIGLAKDTDIYVHPFIRYNWDEASGTFLSEIRIINTEASGYLPEYVKTVNATVSDADKLFMWNAAHALYLKYYEINEAPTDLTDCDFIADDYTSVWYLKNWLFWQGKNRITFNLPFEVAKDWYVSKRFILNLPFHTESIDKYCFVESINRSLPVGDGEGLVSLTAIIY